MFFGAFVDSRGVLLVNVFLRACLTQFAFNFPPRKTEFALCFCEIKWDTITTLYERVWGTSTQLYKVMELTIGLSSEE